MIKQYENEREQERWFVRAFDSFPRTPIDVEVPDCDINVIVATCRYMSWKHIHKVRESEAMERMYVWQQSSK